MQDCSVGNQVRPKGLEGFCLLAVRAGGVTQALECESQTQLFPPTPL